MADDPQSKSGQQRSTGQETSNTKTHELGQDGIVHNDPMRPSSNDHEEAATQGETKILDLEKSQSEPPAPPITVNRTQRRGLFARFALVAEVTEPKHYARPTKHMITVIIASAALAAPLGSTIIFRGFCFHHGK